MPVGEEANEQQLSQLASLRFYIYNIFAFFSY